MRTVDGIYQALAADFFTGTGQQTSASGDLAARFYAVAAQIYALYVQADWTRRQCFPQSAEGEQLDAHAQLRGLSRRQAAKATGAVRFYVDEERMQNCRLIVPGIVYPGVEVSIGKAYMLVERQFENVCFRLSQEDIIVVPNTAAGV